MTDVFTVWPGTLPLLISVPHDGRRIPGDISHRLTPAATSIPDTDWHVAELYDFARSMGATLLLANYSRYVVDLNRSASDDVLYPGQLVTGLCPLETFAGELIYRHDGVSESEKSVRVERFWRPYHDQLGSLLASMRATHGYALLWDAHSIPSTVPRLFSGELPELNIGTNNGASCGRSLEQAVADVAHDGSYAVAVNARFRGGYITRHYGDPESHVHALQLEIAQRAYMNEASGALVPEKVDRLRDQLQRMLGRFLEAGQAAAHNRAAFSQR